jgi:hypothetical protein
MPADQEIVEWNGFEGDHWCHEKWKKEAKKQIKLNIYLKQYDAEEFED